MQLANNIKSVREAHHKLQRECAQVLGVSARYFSNLENYDPERLQYGKLVKLSTYLEEPIEKLVLFK